MTTLKNEVLGYITARWGSVENFLHQEPTFIQDQDNQTITSLNNYRAELLREKFNKRLKQAGKEWLMKNNKCFSKETISRDGFMRVENFLDERSHNKLKFEIMEFLLRTDAEGINWEYRRNSEISHQIKGTHFRRLSSKMEQIISEKVREAIKSQIYIDEKEVVGISNCLHIHYDDDRDGLFHMDNYGAPTVKWFYFPFGCQENDKGFSYCKGSNNMNGFNKGYIERISPYSNTDEYVQERINPNDIYVLGKEVTYFNIENSLVIADTSGFHARARAKAGTLRVTIQGGIDSRVLANG